MEVFVLSKSSWFKHEIIPSKCRSRCPQNKIPFGIIFNQCVKFLLAICNVQSVREVEIGSVEKLFNHFPLWRVCGDFLVILIFVPLLLEHLCQFKIKKCWKNVRELNGHFTGWQLDTSNEIVIFIIGILQTNSFHEIYNFQANKFGLKSIYIFH